MFKKGVKSSFVFFLQIMFFQQVSYRKQSPLRIYLVQLHHMFQVQTDRLHQQLLYEKWETDERIQIQGIDTYPKYDYKKSFKILGQWYLEDKIFKWSCDVDKESCGRRWQFIQKNTL